MVTLIDTATGAAAETTERRRSDRRVPATTGPVPTLDRLPNEEELVGPGAAWDRVAA